MSVMSKKKHLLCNRDKKKYIIMDFVTSIIISYFYLADIDALTFGKMHNS